jgi:fatty acid-binding protein DegV
MYTNQPAVARELAKKLETAGISVDEDHIIQVGASIGSHIGPDACGLVYVAAK